ncbi:MAG: SH3 domain-containing protein [Agathobacter sp.]|nr:SH3 domain-containing protein [Agathobacter sp.]
MKYAFKNSLQKIIALMLVLLITLGVLHIEQMDSFAYTAQTGMICSQDKSMVETKKEPSPNADKANGLLYGKPVTVVDEVTGEDGKMWYKLTYSLKAGGTATGYCPSDKVLLDKDVTVIGNGVVNGNDVKLRNDAGTDRTEVLTYLSVGHKVELLDTTKVDGSLWYRIRTTKNDTTYIGWMLGTYITESMPDIEVDEEYEDYLVRIGFPESYAHSLAILHAQYPKWVFEPVKTGLDWNTVIAEESKSARNLIQTSRDDAMKSYASTEYNWYTNTWVIRDSNSWVTTHPDYIKYCMDPRNWLNATNIFMFESLSYSPSHNITGVNAILSGTFMTKEIANGDGTMLNYANAFMDIAKAVNVSPYHLASRVKQEQGVNGTSGLISGKYPGYEGYYNYFNHGAYGTGNLVYTNGLTYAKNKGWNTRYKSLLGGSEIIAKNYISVGQDTLYFQKFDVIEQGGLYLHQYMTNVEAAISESKSVAKAYTDKTQAFTFKIPVYENMPSEAVTFTASGNRNNYLKSLSVEGYSLTPTFDGAKTSYSLIVENEVASIKVSATPVVSKSTVAGTGTIKLKVGENKISINCKSESGDIKTYTLIVVRKDGEVQPEEPQEYTLISDKYNIGTYITGVNPETKASDFVAGFQCKGGTVKVLTSSGDENTGVVGTGSKLGIYVNDVLVETKELVVRGDISGDGKITIADLVRVNRHTLKASLLNGIQLLAADVNNNSSVNIQDLVLINRHILGIATIK